MLEQALIEILHGALLPSLGIHAVDTQNRGKKKDQSHVGVTYRTVMGSEKLPVTI